MKFRLSKFLFSDILGMFDWSTDRTDSSIVAFLFASAEHCSAEQSAESAVKDGLNRANM